jgi:hypothetical protein
MDKEDFECRVGASVQQNTRALLGGHITEI